MKDRLNKLSKVNTWISGIASVPFPLAGPQGHGVGVWEDKRFHSFQPNFKTGDDATTSLEVGDLLKMFHTYNMGR